MELHEISQILGLVIQCATIITLAYTLSKFIRRPNESQDERIEKLERDQEEIKRRLDKGSRHFEDIDKGTKVTQEAILALIDHAIDNNHTEKLIEAKGKLQSYLINR